MQIGAGTTALNDGKSVAYSCKSLNERARVAHQCKESSTAPSTAAFSALLAEREDYKNRFEALTIRNQRNPGLALEAKELQEKLA